MASCVLDLYQVRHGTRLIVNDFVQKVVLPTKCCINSDTDFFCGLLDGRTALHALGISANFRWPRIPFASAALFTDQPTLVSWTRRVVFIKIGFHWVFMQQTESHCSLPARLR
jgi:hypothetical protein